MPEPTALPTPRRRTLPGALACTLAAALAACGDGGGGGTPPAVPVSSIAGTVTVPGRTATGTRALRGGELLRDPAGRPWTVRPAPRSAAARPADRPGEFVVLTRPGVSAQAVADSVTALDVPGIGRTGLRRTGGARGVGLGVYRAARALSAAQSARVMAALAAQPGVVSVSPNRTVRPLSTPNDTYYPLQWHYPAMNLPEAWTRSTGTAITVAVVDTGIIAHPDLAGQVLPGRDFISDPALAADGDGIDADPTEPPGTGYHGTHVAGTVAARTDNGEGVAGVDWGAKILPVRVLSETEGTLADLLLGVLWAAGEPVDGVPPTPTPARVVNLSLGGVGPCTSAEQEVFTRLRARGVVTVVAAGNDDADAGTQSPANCADVITVGAVGPDGRRAPYSNHGPRVDVMAPGGNANLGVTVGEDTYPGGVLSTSFDDSTQIPQYEFRDGTSMAAPHVAGAVALLLGQEPTLTPAQVLARLRATAAPLGARCDVPGGCGAGLVDASALLSGATPEPTPEPPPPPAPTPPTPAVVAALYVASATQFDYARSRSALLPTDTLKPAYTLGDLQPGEYLVAAWQDLNNDGQVNEAEPFGTYPDRVTVTTTPRDITGIDVTLEAFAVQSLTPDHRDAVGRAVERVARGR